MRRRRAAERRVTYEGDADDPKDFEPFLRQNRKLLVYHGFSDPPVPAFRTIQHANVEPDGSGHSCYAP
jgi:hypothetical protein